MHNYNDFGELTCIECHSTAVHNDKVFGFYKCEDCSVVWGFDGDGPDYDDELLQELNANQMAENLKDPIEEF